ncbi:spermidine synthase [Brevibacillus choshinensis]|uniref:Polyamine aminopropyltransferase n=2 Tax=Brevibacillus choshinensis TaxID=54911 RepID=A0ABX7FX86_BRECH|nr:spermidine synthase [Brevibacillus choshinensis]
MSHERGDKEDLIELEQLLAGPHKILYEGTSKYQNVLVLESPNIQMYLNNQMQFNSMDERMYHEAFVHPAMSLAPKRDRVLCIGSNDGLLLREVFKYADVKQVDLVGISVRLLNAIKKMPEMNTLNERALFDKRLSVFKDEIHTYLASASEKYDVILVDFPDPVNEQIGNLYSLQVFNGLFSLLSEDGILVCQSLSPKKVPLLFWSIARTLERAGFKTLGYHLTVPSFGDWGFHLAGKKTVVWPNKSIAVPHRTLPPDISAWFQFPTNVLSVRKSARVNTSDNPNLHKLYSPLLPAPTANLIALSDLQDYDNSHSSENGSSDTEDLIELQQLLSGPHRILEQGSFDGNQVFIIQSKDVRMYLDKQLQFSSLDERIYHEALVHPAMTLIPKRERILIVGGGDGFAVREVLKYTDVRNVDLVDLDPLVLKVAKSVKKVASLNEHSLSDARVTIYQMDAREFLSEQRDLYDAIIVDFPDPADEVVSSLYTAEFFRIMFQQLTPNGILVCQSHSPESAPSVYWSIGKTLKSIGLNTLSYHVTVPSFGDWGFHLAANESLEWGDRKISVQTETIPVKLDSWFHFTKKIRSVRRNAKANRMSNKNLHKTYRKEVGVILTSARRE